MSNAVTKLKTDSNNYECRYTVKQDITILGPRFPQWCVWDKQENKPATAWVPGTGTARAFPLSVLAALNELNQADRRQWEEQGGDEHLTASTGRKDQGNDVTYKETELENYSRLD